MKKIMKSKKGQLTISGILGILMSVIFLALTMPIQVTYINMMLNSTNDTATELAILAIIPFEVLMLLSSIVYAGRSARASWEEMRYG